jgi:dephospho-CoA kinase
MVRVAPDPLELDLARARTRFAPGLADVARAFSLSPFERDVMLLAIAVELDAVCGDAVASLRGAMDRRAVTVGVALAALAGRDDATSHAALASLLPDSHLARSGLIELHGDGPHVTRELRVPAAVWPRVAGLRRDPPFSVVPTPLALDALVLSDVTRRSVETSLEAARRRSAREVVIGVRGRTGSGRHAVAQAVARALGFPAFFVDARALVTEADVRAVVREAGWHPAAPIVAGALSREVAAVLTRDLSTPFFVVLGDREDSAELARATASYDEIDVGALDSNGRRTLWQRVLPLVPGGDRLDAAALAARHLLGAGQIVALVRSLAQQVEPGGDVSHRDITRARQRLAGPLSTSLAQRVDLPFVWDDLVLPAATARELRLVQAWARHTGNVPLPGGSTSMVCLFVGPPGTGKTMAVQVLARELGLEVLRVDLSQVVNKYIGETEKNLDHVFEIAEDSGSMLFFDEADALFSQRTEVRDANDRYANLETAFLLQRIERHHGLVVMASNLRKNFDPAFLRRIHVVAEFPIPEAAERRRIWARLLSYGPRANELDLDLLARKFAIPGGDIRNAVATARLLAAEDGVPLGDRHLAVGLWRELSKAGRLVSPEDLGPMADAVKRYLGAR